jgi:hypothetical protein
LAKGGEDGADAIARLLGRAVARLLGRAVQPLRDALDESSAEYGCTEGV